MSKKQKKSKVGFGAGLVGGVAICLALFGGGLGFGSGGSGALGVGTAEKVETTESQAVAETTEPVEVLEESTEAERSRKVIEVSVVENSYFYDNKKMELEDFILEMNAMEEEFVIEVSEDKASLKAYRAMLDRLEECGFSYAEMEK